MPGAAAGPIFTVDGTAVASLEGLSGPSAHVEALDITDLDDTAAAWVPNGVVDGGEVTLELGDRGTQFTVGATASAVLTHSNGTAATTTNSFSFLVVSKEHNYEVKGKQASTVVLKLTGAIT